MHVLIVGVRGQLGQALEQLYSANAQRKDKVKVTSWQRPEYDIANPQIIEQVAALRPDVVINAAAWTNVDAAEANPAATFAANAEGPGHLALGCAGCNAALVQLSTNEIFAGEAGHFYAEGDAPAPNSLYARSKLAGELAVQAVLDRSYIVRVAWLFGPGGSNFPTKILAAADKHGTLRVVNDEFGNPTYAPDVAQALAQLVETQQYGRYHLVNSGYASRYEFACTVLQASGRGHIPVTAIAHSEWPRPTQPPLHAVLINHTAASLGIALRPWRAAVDEYVESQYRLSRTG